MDGELEVVLQKFLLPENSARAEAEETFKRLGKDPALVPALLRFVRHATLPDVRQLAAVLLRKKVISLWTQVPADGRTAAKAVLLECLAGEPSPLVRTADAHLVAIVAKHEVQSGEWPELLPFLFQCSQSAEEGHREVALVLFTALMETSGEVLRPHFKSMQSSFIAALKDPVSSRVRVAALKAVGALVECIESEEEVLLIRELINPILEVARFCAQNGDEDSAVRVCEIVEELIESPAPILGPFMPSIVAFALELAANPKFDPSTRFQAAQVIAWIAGWKPKTLAKNNLIPTILSVFCPLLSEPCGEKDNEEDEAYELSAQRFSAQVLDAIAMSVPKKHIFAPILAFAKANIGSPSEHLRFAAVMSIAVITEGCCDVVRKKLDTLLPLIVQGLQDPSQKVRGSACFAIGQLAEYVQPDVSRHFKIILPPIFIALDDANKTVQEKAYYALATFCENLGEEILEFLDPLMRKLVDGLQKGPRGLQEMCLSAIGSAAAAAEAKFLPYAEGVLNILKGFMGLSSEPDLIVRARAYELVGIIGLAVGRPVVNQDLPAFIDAALKGFAMDSSELREYGHGFFGDAAKILGADFAPFLPFVVPLALASCRMEDGIIVEEEDKTGEAVPASLKSVMENLAEDEEEEEEEEESLRSLKGLSVRTGVLDEKAAATQALGAYALHSAQAFMPYFEDAMKAVTDNSSYSHEDVRLQAVLSLQYLATAAFEAFPSSPSTGLSPQGKLAFDAAMEVFLRVAKEEEDKETSAQAFSSIAALVKMISDQDSVLYEHLKALPDSQTVIDAAKAAHHALAEPYVPRICEVVLIALRELLPCQRLDDEEEGGGGGV